MVRYVPIEEILILIMCFRESYEKNSQHKRQIGRCNCILSQKNIKLQPVTPLMPLEALLIPVNLTVTPMALTEAQVVILYFFHYKTQKQPILRHLSLFPMYFKFHINLVEVSLIY